MSIGLFAARSTCIFGVGASCYKQAQTTNGVQNYFQRCKERTGSESLEQEGRNLISAFNTITAPLDTLALGIIAGLFATVHDFADIHAGWTKIRTDLANSSEKIMNSGKPKISKILPKNNLEDLLFRANKLSSPLGRILFPVAVASTAVNLGLQWKAEEDSKQ